MAEESSTCTGVDVRYTTHSARVASTSFMAETGLSLKMILDAALARAFERSYHKSTIRDVCILFVALVFWSVFTDHFTDQVLHSVYSCQ